jgi:phenylalanyl-tRNA synthetase beta chain
MAHGGLVRPAASARGRARKLKEPVLVGELYLDRLYKLPLRKPAAREISRFQPVRRDFSLVVGREHRVGAIDQAVAGLHIPELVEWRAREVFRDAKLGAGEYALLLGAPSRPPTAPCARRSCRVPGAQDL